MYLVLNVDIGAFGEEEAGGAGVAVPAGQVQARLAHLKSNNSHGGEEQNQVYLVGMMQADSSSSYEHLYYVVVPLPAGPRERPVSGAVDDARVGPLGDQHVERRQVPAPGGHVDEGLAVRVALVDQLRRGRRKVGLEQAGRVCIWTVQRAEQSGKAKALKK